MRAPVLYPDENPSVISEHARGESCEEPTGEVNAQELNVLSFVQRTSAKKTKRHQPEDGGACAEGSIHLLDDNHETQADDHKPFRPHHNRQASGDASAVGVSVTGIAAEDARSASSTSGDAVASSSSVAV